MISVRSAFSILCALFLVLFLLYSVSATDAIGSSSSHTTTLILSPVGNSKLADFSVDIFTALSPALETSSLQLIYTANSESAIELIQQHPDYIIAGLPQYSDIQDSFLWVGPIYHLHPVVIVEYENEEGIRITQPSDLSEFRVGVLEYDHTADIALELVNANQIVSSPTYLDLFALLRSQKIDVIVTEHFHAVEYLTEHYALGAYEFIFFLPPVPHYFVFAEDTDPAIISSYQDALDTFKTTPSSDDARYTQYEEIVSKSFPPFTFRSSYYVLIFSSSGEYIPQTTKILEGMDRIFSSASNIRYNLENLCIDCLPASSSDSEIAAHAVSIAEKAMSHYDNVVPDAILSFSFEALNAAQHYESLQKTPIPIIYGMAAPGSYRGGGSVGVLLTYEIGKTLALAQHMHPARQTFYIISSRSRTNQLVLEKIKEIETLNSEFIFYYAPYDLSLEELIKDINTHYGAIVLLNDYRFYDGSRSFYLTNEDVIRLTSSISAPVYTLTDVYSNEDTGVTGGYEASMERVGEILGIYTSRVLFGEDISNIPTYIYRPLQSTIHTDSIQTFYISRDLFYTLALLTLSLLITAGIFNFMQRKIFHAQADMRRTQRILEKTIEFMPVAVVVLAPYTEEHIYINKAMKQIIDSGLTYYIDENYAEFLEIKNNVVETGEVYEGEKENEIGKQVFHFYVSPIRDSLENIQFVMIQVIDVTETRIKERETHAALVRLDQFIERDVDAVAFVQPIYDEDGKIMSGKYYKVNKEFCELLRFRSDDILGKEMSGFLISDDFLKLFDMLTDTTPLVRFSYFQSENEGQYLSGFVFEVGTNPSLFCLHLTDETEYYYHHLIEKSATQRLETMLTELAILNDQIRNPLTVILCSLESDIIHAQSEFETEIANINTAIDLLDRRFLIVDSLRARIKEKEKERMRDEHVIRTSEEEDFL